MRTKLNVGVIGLGIGRYHVARYAECPRTNIVAVADKDEQLAEKIAGEYDVESVYTDYRKLVQRKDIAAVSVCLPNFLHAPVSIEALRAEKHVLCEKPMASTRGEAEKMMQTAQEMNKKLMIGMTHRYRKDTRFLKKIIREGQLGKIYYAHACWFRRRGMPVADFPPDGEMGRGTWFIQKEKAGGGVLMDIGVHMLDLVWYLMGRPQFTGVCGFVSDTLGKERITEFSVDDFTAAFIRCESAARISLEVSWVANIEQKQSIEILGTRGGAKLDPLTVYTVQHNELVDILPRVDRGDPYLGEVNNFANAILDDEPMISPPEDAFKIMRVLEAIYTSAAEEKEISLG